MVRLLDYCSGLGCSLLTPKVLNSEVASGLRQCLRCRRGLELPAPTEKWHHSRVSPATDFEQFRPELIGARGLARTLADGARLGIQESGMPRLLAWSGQSSVNRMRTASVKVDDALSEAQLQSLATWVLGLLGTSLDAKAKH